MPKIMNCRTSFFISFLVTCAVVMGGSSPVLAQTDTTLKTGAGVRWLVTDTSQASDSLAIDNHGITLSDAKFKKRQRLIGYGSAIAYGGMLYTLNQAWYAKYPRSSFHFYNDNGEWNQMDKAGHAWSVYQLTRATFSAWSWAGASQKKALTLAGISGPGFLTIIEILDGFSQKWGFSWGDMGANLLGSGIFIAQQALWKEQRLGLKFSFHTNNYREPLLQTRADNLFGNSWQERMLKDYNAQTYWLSGNLKSFFPGSHLPSWLNIALGYGADGMFGGYENVWTDAMNQEFDRRDIKRTRQFYLAPDVDLTRIKTKSKFLKTSFFLLNSLKFPAPALRVDSRGHVRVHALWF